jgi:hypothetical protein
MKSKLLIVRFAVTIAVTGLAPEASGVESMRLFQSLNLAAQR